MTRELALIYPVSTRKLDQIYTVLTRELALIDAVLTRELALIDAVKCPELKQIYLTWCLGRTCVVGLCVQINVSHRVRSMFGRGRSTMFWTLAAGCVPMFECSSMVGSPKTTCLLEVAC